MSHTLTIYTKSPTSFLLGISRFISPTLIPEGLYERSISIFIYKNEKDLKEKLNGAFASQNEKKIHFSSELEVSIETEDKKIPPYMGKCLVEILPQQLGITKLTVADKLVSASQRNQLAPITEIAEQKQRQVSLRMRNGILTGIGLFVFAATVMATIGMPLAFSLMLKNTLTVGMISGVISHIRNIYLDSTQYYYQKNGKLKSISNVAEKHAFHIGEQAKNWKGYFTSYGRLSTYTHPIAFAAGMMHGINKLPAQDTSNDKYKIIRVYGTDSIDLVKIDNRIKRGGYIMQSCPTQEDISIPMQHFDEIFAKLIKEPRFSQYNQHLFPKNTKTTARP
ncbi:hypothetical protein [Candidatus Berkiella aquae]|uniref:Uncharacterized protein n=1 Tax=Candidatus Berkiella aquae TaxID=295108 RepID=A0A0Q9Z2X7_9GAMM|nr:hypothetical protein [Candidatus Berkiella aquae]MCS5711837.1 hypothetical protein [Candidatus Berkiella aquae]